MVPVSSRPAASSSASLQRARPLAVSLTAALLLASPALRAQAGAAPVSPEAPLGPTERGADGGDVHALDAIVVTGSRTERPLGEAPVATQIITREEIATSGAQSLGELLEEQPGVYLERSFAGAAPQLQGLPADYTLLLVDGVRQPGRLNGVIDLDRFSIEDIERVEIVRGASSALYGSDAMAGVINIITRRARKPFEVTGQGSFGAYRTIDLSAGVGLRRSSWSTRLSGGAHSRDAFDLDPSDPATSQSASTQYNVASQSTFSPVRGLEIAVTGDYRHQDRQAVDIGAAGGAIFDRENLTETGSVLLRPTWRFEDGSRLELRSSLAVFRDQFLLDQRGASDLDELQDTREQLAQLGAQYDTLLGSEHLLSVGTEGWYESLRTARLTGGRGRRTRGALYVQDEWTLSAAPLLSVLPGARLDADSQFGVYATPRLAVRFDPAPPITLRASYGWGYKAPDFRELYLLFENPSVGYLVEGNTELEPERSRSLGASVELRPHRAVWLSVQGFYNRISDRIGTNLAPADEVGPRRFRYENIDSATSFGADTALRVDPWRGLRLDLGYSWTRTRNEADGQPLPGQPLHRATAAVRYSEPRLGFTASCRAALVGSRPFFQDNDGDDVAERRDASGYASVDARLAQRIGFGLSTFVLAENLLDAGDAELLPIPPRTLSGGVTLDY